MHTLNQEKKEVIPMNSYFILGIRAAGEDRYAECGSAESAAIEISAESRQEEN